MRLLSQFMKPEAIEIPVIAYPVRGTGSRLQTNFRFHLPADYINLRA